MFARNLLLRSRNVRLATIGVGGVAAAGYAFFRKDEEDTVRILHETNFEPAMMIPVATSSSDDRLPVYTREEVAKHTTPETRIWVTFRDGVYDITEFVQAHPGGAQRIM